MAEHRGFTVTLNGYGFYVEHYRDSDGHTTSDAWIVHCNENNHSKHIAFSVDALFRIVSEHAN